jgi:hypothetical protein
VVGVVVVVVVLLEALTVQEVFAGVESVTPVALVARTANVWGPLAASS